MGNKGVEGMACKKKSERGRAESHAASGAGMQRATAVNQQLQKVYVHIAHLLRSIFCAKTVFQHVFCGQEAVSTGDKLP